MGHHHIFFFCENSADETHVLLWTKIESDVYCIQMHPLKLVDKIIKKGNFQLCCIIISRTDEAIYLSVCAYS